MSWTKQTASRKYINTSPDRLVFSDYEGEK